METYKTITWRETPTGFESGDWHWQLAEDVHGTYDVRDTIAREWVAFGLTLDKAKAECETRWADELREVGL